MQKSLALAITLLAFHAGPVLALNATPAADVSRAQPAQSRGEARSANPASTPVPEKPHKPERIAVAPREPKPDAEGAEKKPSFWQKVFGRKKATPAPATPEPTPAPTSRTRRTRPASTDDSSGEAKKSESSKSAKSKPANDSPEPEKPKADEATAGAPPKDEANSSEPAKAPEADDAPALPKKTSKTKAVAEARNIPPTTSADAEVQEKYKYDMAKAKALTDPDVLKLKDKAASAVNEDEARKAQKAYTKALFSKMRSIDGSIKERIDRIEAGIIRRLEGSE